MKKSDIAKMNEAREFLRGILNPGDTVYTRVNSVARSGMSRRISFFLIRNNQPENITYHVAHAIGDGPAYDRATGDGIRVTGCGMDMCFASVYNLGRALFPIGFAVDGRGRNGDTSGWDKDGGYALKNANF